jgi:hypothetical protein
MKIPSLALCLPHWVSIKLRNVSYIHVSPEVYFAILPGIMKPEYTAETCS